MAIEQKWSVGSESSINSIASESNPECVLIENCETSQTTVDLSGVPLKVRKPYTISKQREKWTEEEHQRFIEALKLYGRAWQQIEESIGTKTAVQIRSHAQKFFSKVMKEGSCSAEASTEPITIPPPRPKRKPLYPYPRKLVENPSITKQPPTLVENATSTNVKTSDREVQSPISVLSPEGSQLYTSHGKAQGNGCDSRTSSGSNLSHVVEKIAVIKDSSTQGKENEDLSLTLHCSCPSPDDSTLMSAGDTLMDIKNTSDEDNSSDNWIKCVGGGAPIKSIKLFGCTVAVTEQSEYSERMNDEKRPSEKGSKSFSCTGSNSNSFSEVKNGEATLDSVDSKLEYTQQANGSNEFKRRFYLYKRCSSDREAVYTPEDRESQRIRVYL